MAQTRLAVVKPGIHVEISRVRLDVGFCFILIGCIATSNDPLPWHMPVGLSLRLSAPLPFSLSVIQSLVVPNVSRRRRRHTPLLEYLTDPHFHISNPCPSLPHSTASFCHYNSSVQPSPAARISLYLFTHPSTDPQVESRFLRQAFIRIS